MTDWPHDQDLKLVLEKQWALADRLGAKRVQDIPLPWRHHWGTVVDVEYPEDRPNVVDLVFSDGLKTAETKDARYVRGATGLWAPPSAEHLRMATEGTGVEDEVI